MFAVGANILNTVTDPVTGTILAQTGSVNEEYSASDNAEWWQHVGFASRPAFPVAKSSAAECIAVRCSDRDRIIATRDVRGQAIYGNLADGECCVYAPIGQARILLKVDGSVSIVTTSDNTATGNTLKRSLSPDPLQGIVDYSPWGYAKLNSTGYHLMTSSGARLDGGGMSAPGVPSALGSYWSFSAASVGLQASVVTLGPTPAAALPVALATPLLAYLALVQATCQAVYNYAFAVGSTPAAVGTAPNLALAALIAAATSALSATSAPPITVTSTSTSAN